MSEKSVKPVWLPEHIDNPFCRALPPPRSLKEQFKALRIKPDYSPEQREYPPHLRRFCVLRLRDYMDPLGRQLDLAERLNMAILSGYVGRNPATLEYRLGLNACSDTVTSSGTTAKNAIRSPVIGKQSESMIGFAVLGCPGMGKTATVERVLSQYPLLVEHHFRETITQIPYLKIECPSQGSPRGFCLSFFQALGDRLQTDFSQKLGLERKTIDKLMLLVQRYAYLYALGVLVVDEIQHLAKSKQGPEALVNFFVAMSNAIKVPIVLVGTMAALDIIQSDFRSGRRGAGIGTQFWDPLRRGPEWDEFIEEMWKYQWTRVPTVLDPEISEALYDECQGVIDIVIKLFIFAQLRVITRAEANKEADQTETMSAELIREVAAEDLKMIEPMMRALRSNDQRAIQRFDDLKPLARHLEDTVLAVTGLPASEIRHRLAIEEASRTAAAAKEGSDAAILGILKIFKLSLATQRDIVAKVRRLHPSGDIPTVCAAAVELAIAFGAKSAKPKAVERMAVDGDLRDILAMARVDGRSGYEAFLAAGVVKEPLADLAA